MGSFLGFIVGSFVGSLETNCGKFGKAQKLSQPSLRQQVFSTSYKIPAELV